MADQELVLTIKTPTELQGVENALQATEREIGVAKALGQNYDELNSKLDKLKSAKAGYTEEQKATKQAADSVVNVTQADIKASAEAAEATHHLHVEKRELREIINHTTREYPLLHEAAKAALNPITFLVAAPIAAFEIWKTRVDELVESLGAVIMPDLSAGTEQAKQLAVHWHGVADAVAQANKEFASAEQRFERQKAEAAQELDADKKLLEVQKEKALANLDLQRGQMSNEAYDFNKQRIESKFAQKETDMEDDASKQREAAKEREKFTADIQAKNAQKANDAIKLPADIDAIISNQQAAADQQQQVIEEAKKRRADIGNLGSKGLIGNQIDYAKFYGRYGKDATTDAAMKLEDETIGSASETRDRFLGQIRSENERKAQKEKAQTEAADTAGKATAIGNELPEVLKQERKDRATRDAVSKGQQDIAFEKYTAEASKGGSEIVGLLKQYHDAILHHQKDQAQQLKAAILQIQQLQRENKRNSNYTNNP